MSLIHCPECDREISDRALSCPHCGYPMTPAQPQIAPDPDGYAVVLVDCPQDTAAVGTILMDQITSCSALLERLPNGPLVKAEEIPAKVAELMEHTPAVISRKLRYEEADKLCRALMQAGANCKIVADVQADHPDTLDMVEPVQPPNSDPAQSREPLSFGGVVAAVVVGLLIVVFLLSFL